MFFSNPVRIQYKYNRKYYRSFHWIIAYLKCTECPKVLSIFIQLVASEKTSRTISIYELGAKLTYTREKSSMSSDSIRILDLTQKKQGQTVHRNEDFDKTREREKERDNYITTV